MAATVQQLKSRFETLLNNLRTAAEKLDADVGRQAGDSVRDIANNADEMFEQIIRKHSRDQLQ